MAKKTLLKATPDYEDYTENVVKIDEEIIKELGIMAGEYVTKSCCSSGGGCESSGECGGCSNKSSSDTCKTKKSCCSSGGGCCKGK